MLTMAEVLGNHQLELVKKLGLQRKLV
jgi:hypothetical protein